MQAILTKFSRDGSHITAQCSRGSVTLPASGGSHIGAAHELIRRICDADALGGLEMADNPFNRPFVSGELPDGSIAHVYTGSESQLLFPPKEA